MRWMRFLRWFQRARAFFCVCFNAYVRWLIDSLANLNVVTTGTITKASRLTSGVLDNMTCYKKGNVVVVSARVHTINPSIASTGQYFQIPEGFRPKHHTYGYGYMNIDSVGWVTVASDIREDGSVYLGYSNANTANQAFFYATYTA